MAKTKKGPLSKVECYYIDGHYRDLEVAQMAEDLNRTMTSVENYIKKTHTDKNPNRLTAGDQFAYHKGSTVMTENASTLSDARRKSYNKKENKCVTKIK